MTDDVIHSTQYYNRAFLANLKHRPLKLGRLIVLQELHPQPQKFCFVGNSLFSSSYPLDFSILVIFRWKNIKGGHKLELTYLYACWIIANTTGGQKSLQYWEGLEPSWLPW